MKRLRGQMPPPQQQEAARVSEASLSTLSTREEEDVEQAAIDYSYQEQHGPRFEEMRAAMDTHGDTLPELKKVKTGRSGVSRAQSTRSHRSRRSQLTVEDYYDNPYVVDRVNTAGSFAGSIIGSNRPSRPESRAGSTRGGGGSGLSRAGSKRQSWNPWS